MGADSRATARVPEAPRGPHEGPSVAVQPQGAGSSLSVWLATPDASERRSAPQAYTPPPTKSPAPSLSPLSPCLQPPGADTPPCRTPTRVAPAAHPWVTAASREDSAWSGRR
ncbi:unnamed protein product [Arctogadus glacialis]